MKEWKEAGEVLNKVREGMTVSPMILNYLQTALKALEILGGVEGEMPALKEELEQKNKIIESLSLQLDNGRHCLMGVQRNELIVENALEAFGFGRNGLADFHKEG